MLTPKGPFYEYSVVYSDRATNLMSPPFQETMKNIAAMLKRTFSAEKVAIIPGSGTYAMEAVARQFATNRKALVIRNGFFSFRWSDIFDVCNITNNQIILPAYALTQDPPRFAPYEISALEAKIMSEKPAVVFAAHVETATGIILSHDYIKRVAAAAHSVGALFVLDCIASGCVWTDMKELDIDVIISAPQKAFSAPASCGIVLLGPRGVEALSTTKPTSFACNLPQWLDVMTQYENGSFKYYTTLPTDALIAFDQISSELFESFGGSLEKLRNAHFELGNSVRNAFKSRGYESVAAEGFEAPGVVVVYGSAKGPAAGAMVSELKKVGLQVAGGVPFKLEGNENGVDGPTQTFRIGLFGVDKLKNIPGTVDRLMRAIDDVYINKL